MNQNLINIRWSSSPHNQDIQTQVKLQPSAAKGDELLSSTNDNQPRNSIDHPKRKNRSKLSINGDFSNIDGISKSDASIPAYNQEQALLDTSEELIITELFDYLCIEEFLDRFQELSWKIATTDREADATQEQQENVKRVIDIVALWMKLALRRTIEEIGVQGEETGSSLYVLATEKGMDLRALAELFELIEEDTFKTGNGWAEWFQNENSEGDLEWNRTMEEELCLMRDKERVFLASLMSSLDGFEIQHIDAAPQANSQPHEANS